MPPNERACLPLELGTEIERRTKRSRRIAGWSTLLAFGAILVGFFGTFDPMVVAQIRDNEAAGAISAIDFDDGSTGPAATVMGLARIMPRGDVAGIAAPFGSGDARIEEILVAIGQEVQRGEPLARLDNYASLRSAVVLAETQLAVRQAQLVQIRHEIAISRAEAQAALAQARAMALATASDLKRATALAERGVVTDATLASANLAAHEAELSVSQAEAAHARYASVSLEEQLDVIVAARNVAAAEAELERARVDLDRAIVRAPITGTVLDIHVTPGQKPPQSGMMEIGDTSHMMAEVEIWQDRIAAVSPGQPVEISADALGRSLYGRVETVGLKIGRQGLVSDDVAANADARVVRVLVALDAGSSRVAAAYTNLEAVARILGDPSAPVSQ